jgi:CHASE3 domain sensor protein
LANKKIGRQEAIMGNFGQTGKPQGRWLTIAAVTLGGIVLAVLVAATVWQGNVHESDSSAAESHSTTAALLQDAGTEAGIAAPLLRQYVETGDARLVSQIQEHAAVAVKNLTGAISEGGVADLTPIAAEGGQLTDGLGRIIALRQAGDVPAAAAALEQLSPVLEKVTTEVQAAVTLELQEASKLQSSADTADDAASWLLIAAIIWGAALGVGVTALVVRSMFGKRVSKTPSTI